MAAGAARELRDLLGRLPTGHELGSALGVARRAGERRLAALAEAGVLAEVEAGATWARFVWCDRALLSDPVAAMVDGQVRYLRERRANALEEPSIRCLARGLAGVSSATVGRAVARLRSVRNETGFASEMRQIPAPLLSLTDTRDLDTYTRTPAQGASNMGENDPKPLGTVAGHAWRSGARITALSMRLAALFADRYKSATRRPPPPQASAWSPAWHDCASWFLDAAAMEADHAIDVRAETLATRALETFFADAWVRSNRYPVRAFVDHPDRYCPEPETLALERESERLMAERTQLAERWSRAKEAGDLLAQSEIRKRNDEIRARLEEIGLALDAGAQARDALARAKAGA